MATALPSGIGNDQQADQATAFMREQPWYRQLFLSWGVNPDNPGDFHLSDDQQKQLLATARTNGIGISDKYEIDRNGAIREGSHKLRNTLIGAGIGAAALTGLGAAGIGPLTGLFGSGTAAGLGAAETATPFGVGGLSAASLGLPAVGVGAAGAGGVGSVLGTGSKLASLFGGVNKLGGALSGGSDPSARGNAYAAQENQLANNRAAAARIDQGGPSADAQAFRNALRASLVARMDPNAAPIALNGHALPQLATPEGVASAAATRDALARRQAAGKSATLFGVGDPTQEELDARAKAEDAAGIGTGLNSRIAQVGDTLQTGARLAGLGKGAWDLGKGIAGLF